MGAPPERSMRPWSADNGHQSRPASASTSYVSARRFAEGHALKDPEKRRLFGDHLVLAGLPE
jgi:hypothetical protein